MQQEFKSPDRQQRIKVENRSPPSILSSRLRRGVRNNKFSSDNEDVDVRRNLFLATNRRSSMGFNRDSRRSIVNKLNSQPEYKVSRENSKLKDFKIGENVYLLKSPKGEIFDDIMTFKKANACKETVQNFNNGSDSLFLLKYKDDKIVTVVELSLDMLQKSDKYTYLPSEPDAYGYILNVVDVCDINKSDPIGISMSSFLIKSVMENLAIFKLKPYEKIIEITNNYRPNLILLGHNNSLSRETINKPMVFIDFHQKQLKNKWFSLNSTRNN